MLCSSTRQTQTCHANSDLTLPALSFSLYHPTPLHVTIVPITKHSFDFFSFLFQLVSGLGWALFEALDYGNKREEQNVLSPDLELLIDLMTAADNGKEKKNSK